MKKNIESVFNKIDWTSVKVFTFGMIVFTLFVLSKIVG